MNHALAEHALSHAKSPKNPPKALKEMHVKELHSGGYMVQKHSGKPGEPPTEHGAADLDGVHDMMEEHMGAPNEGEGDGGEA